jgi:hypothetical protein
VASPRRLELEFGYFVAERDAGENELLTPQVVLNFGLVPRLELIGEFEVRTSEEEPAHVSDPAVFLKGVLRDGVLQGESGASIAVELGSTFPGTEEDDERVGFEAIAIVSASVGPFLSHLNAGGGVSRHGGGLGLWGVIVELPATDELRFVSEVNGEAREAAPPENRFLLGCIWEATSLPLSLDAGLRRGLSSHAPDWEITMGFTVDMPP